MFILILSVLLVVIGLILYARWNYGTLEKMGLPVDKPHFILGNTYYTYNKPAALWDIDTFKRLGSVYGVYEGREAQVHICDAELIRLVTTKDADYFNGKRILDFRDPFLNELMDFQPYDKWKTLRTVMTPQFSSAKVKMVSKSLCLTMDEFTAKLKESIDSAPGNMLEKYDLRKEIYALFTDMLAKSFFSVKLDNPSGNELVKLIRGLLEPETQLSPMVDVVCYSFPFLSKFLPSVFSRKITDGLTDLFLNLMETRRKSGEVKNDVVDFCIEQMEKTKTPEYQKAGITKQSVVVQAFTFFFAGQDQVSSIIATMIYYFLTNPEVEKKANEEVETVWARNKGEIGYENISEFEYLQACITESTRLVPFFSRAERVCTKDWENKEFNLKIKKGIVIQIPIWAANRNPKYFEDPEKFDPARFLPGRKEKIHPYAFTSFGFGPRNCFGQKFANDLMALISIHLIKHFKFVLREDSKPEYLPAGPIFTPHLPFFFDVKNK